MFGRRKRRDVIHRWEGNPIITIDDLPFRCADVTNAGAVKIGDTYILLITVVDLRGHSAFHVATSQDGYRFVLDETPFKTVSASDDAFFQHQKWGVLDARITPLDGGYYVMYVVDGQHGFRLALDWTKDFSSWEHIGFISEPDTKAGALFPEKIGGRYARVERPGDGGRVWISFSDDLIHWGSAEALLSPRGGFWDSARVGCAVPPVRVKDGEWLLIYYGVKATSAGPLYRLGAAFLDPRDPTKTLMRSNVPILSPREIYERIGDIGNLVFSCGAIVENNTLALYYGASRSCICLGTTALDEIIESCELSEEDV